MDLSPSSLQLMKALVEAGARGAARDQLAHLAGISHASFYRAVRPLLEARLVEVEPGQRYVLPLDNLFNFRFKLWHDAERLLRLAPLDQSQVLEIVRQARAALGDNLRCLWLVGSAAQGTLTDQSDLDFLAVVRKDRLYHPHARRAVNFVMMSEAEFERKYMAGDEFVQQAIRHGIALVDVGFAQDFYAQPLRADLAPPALSERADTLDKQGDKLHFFLRENELGEALKVLHSIAVGTGRLLLRLLGQPASTKEDMLGRCGQLFGPGLVGLLSAALDEERPPGKRGMLQLQRKLADYHQSFMQQLTHLRAFASLPAAAELDLRAMAGQVLQELLPGAEVVEEDRLRADLVLRQAGRLFVFEFKSLARGLSASQVVQFADVVRRRRRRPKPQAVLIVNSHRDTPLPARPAISVAAMERARALSVAVVTAVDLLRAHNALHLDEDARPHEVARQLFECR